jgi:putative sporulation protein YtxC
VILSARSAGRYRGFYRGSIERYLRASCPGGPPVHLNIEGFYNFRMRSFQRELQQALDSAIDIHFAEKEYREFIRLLKYFLHMQQPKIELLHLSVDLQGRLQIMDRCFRRIDPLEWEELGADRFR